MSYKPVKLFAALIVLTATLTTAGIAGAQYGPPPGGASWGRPLADLAAHRIDFQLVNKYHPYKGQVRIVGVVKNVSGGHFRGHAMARLEEDRGQGWRQVSQKSFQSLAPGQEIPVSFQRSWLAPAGGANMLVRYRLRVLAGPDTPEANGGNNVIVRDSGGLNALFQGPARIEKVKLPPRYPGRWPLSPIPGRQLRRR